MSRRALNSLNPGPRLNYDDLLRRFGHVFKLNRPCIIGNSLDAMVSYLILSESLGWTLAGIYAPPALYLATECEHQRLAAVSAGGAIRARNPVFVGITVCQGGLHSVGKDLVHWAPDYPLPSDPSRNSALNPNLLRGVTRRTFHDRLPFGLACFILCCMTYWGLLKTRRWAPSLASVLLYLDRGMQKGFRNPDCALRWVDWLASHTRLAHIPPFGSMFQGSDLRRTVEVFADIAAHVRTSGVSPRSQSLPLRGPFAWKKLSGLVQWLQEATGMRGRFDELFACRRLVFAVHTECTIASPNSFRTLRIRRPFAYRFAGSGARRLIHEYFSRRMPRSSAPLGINE